MKEASFSPFLRIELEPEDVFPYTKEEVAGGLAALVGANVSETAMRTLRIIDREVRIGSDDDFLYYGVHHAHKKFPLASLKDKCSFATVVAYFMTGRYGGFGIGYYLKEEEARIRGTFLLESMNQWGFSSRGKIHALIVFLEAHYFL